MENQIKSWEQLEMEMKGVTSLICEQDFTATKLDSYNDNAWGCDSEEQDCETSWKLDTVSRMLQENLDYGKYNEKDDEISDEEHSMSLELRCMVVSFVADKWVKTNEVYNIESAQKCADNYIKEIDN